MKYLSLFLALLGVQLTFGQPKPILAAEYFFGTVDPGFGNATPIPVPNPAEQLELVFEAPTIGLAPGLHSFNFRVKRDSAWSDTHRRLFFVRDLELITEDTAAIMAAEFYFGNIDPGYGQGIPLAVPQPGTEVTLVDQLDLSSLTPGLHEVSIRMRNANLSWGDTHRRLFFLPDTVSTYRLTEIRYELQQAGTAVGSGSLSISPSQYAIALQFDVATVGLAEGFYDLCVTAVDEINRESAPVCRVVEIIGGATSLGSLTEHGLQVFPNPTTGPLRLQSEQAPMLQYQLSDAAGRVLQRETLPPGSLQADLNLSHLPAGTYYLAIEQPGTVWVTAVVKR